MRAAPALLSLTGEAFVNQRKGKLIPSYELELKLEWQGEGEEDTRGLLHLPYLADENAGEPDSLEGRFSATTDTPAARACKEALQKQGLPRVRAAVAAWVREMQAGGPAAGAAAPSAEAAPPPAAAKAKPAAAKPALPAEPVDGKATIKLTERFYCRPMDLFEALTVTGRVRAFTQSEASVSAAPGAPFSMFSGNISGFNEEMEPGKLIVQRWRFRNWAEGVFSTVRLELSEPEHGTTLLKLVQTGVPVADSFGNENVVETTTNGWKQNILDRIRRVFGYGA